MGITIKTIKPKTIKEDKAAMQLSKKIYKAEQICPWFKEIGDRCREMEDDAEKIDGRKLPYTKYRALEVGIKLDSNWDHVGNYCPRPPPPPPRYPRVRLEPCRKIICK